MCGRTQSLPHILLRANTFCIGGFTYRRRRTAQRERERGLSSPSISLAESSFSPLHFLPIYLFSSPISPSLQGGKLPWEKGQGVAGVWFGANALVESGVRCAHAHFGVGDTRDLCYSCAHAHFCVRLTRSVTTGFRTRDSPRWFSDPSHSGACRVAPEWEQSLVTLVCADFAI